MEILRGGAGGLLAHSPRHEIIGAAGARLRFATGQQQRFRGATLRCFGVDALARLVVLGAAKRFGGGVAIRPAVLDRQTFYMSGHRRGYAPARQIAGPALDRGVEIVDRLLWRLQRRQQSRRTLEQLAEFVDEAGIFLPRLDRCGRLRRRLFSGRRCSFHGHRWRCRRRRLRPCRRGGHQQDQRRRIQRHASCSLDDRASQFHFPRHDKPIFAPWPGTTDATFQIILKAITKPSTNTAAPMATHMPSRFSIWARIASP